jgi:hypothetical protein
MLINVNTEYERTRTHVARASSFFLMADQANDL